MIKGQTEQPRFRLRGGGDRYRVDVLDRDNKAVWGFCGTLMQCHTFIALLSNPLVEFGDWDE